MKTFVLGAVGALMFSGGAMAKDAGYEDLLNQYSHRDCISFHLSYAGEDPESDEPTGKQISMFATISFSMGFAHASGLSTDEDYRSFMKRSREICIASGSNPETIKTFTEALSEIKDTR